MLFTPALEPARLLRRYKRFLADVEFPDGRVLTVHCPNTGAMTNCTEPQQQVWLSHSLNPKRKYAYTWELGSSFVGHHFVVNTRLANPLVEEALRTGLIQEIGAVDCVHREHSVGASRLDFYIPGNEIYIEVKSVTLLNDNQGLFPDAVTKRGQKHVQELTTLAQSGHRCVLFFCVNHSGIEHVRPAVSIDPDYSHALGRALDAGVEVLCYKTQISPKGIQITEPVPFIYT